MLRKLRGICLALPEAIEAKSFGHPVWKAGKKTFCALERYGGRLRICFRADPDEHPFLVDQERFQVAPYTGQHGWVLLDAEEDLDWHEVEDWVTTSYRHYALKRMLRALDVR